MKKEYGVLFDLDGTILYTDELIFATFKRVFKKYKPEYELSNEELLSFLGPSLKDTFMKYFDKELVPELIEYYQEYNHNKHKDYVYVYPTVIDTLNVLKEMGYPLAVVTTKSKKAAYIGLELFDLTKYFDVVICLDDVKITKPNPECVIKAMDKLKIDKAVMIGDNVSDILAGKNAGIETIGVKWSPKGYDLMKEAKVDLLVDEMKDIVPFIKEMS